MNDLVCEGAHPAMMTFAISRFSIPGKSVRWRTWTAPVVIAREILDENLDLRMQ